MTANDIDLAVREYLADPAVIVFRRFHRRRGPLYWVAVTTVAAATGLAGLLILASVPAAFFGTGVVLLGAGTEFFFRALLLAGAIRPSLNRLLWQVGRRPLSRFLTDRLLSQGHPLSDSQVAMSVTIYEVRRNWLAAHMLGSLLIHVGEENEEWA